MGFVRIPTLCLKQWIAFTTFATAKKYVNFLLKKIFNEAVRKENLMNWDEVTYKRKFSLSLKCGSASGVDCTRQPLMLNTISEKISLTDDHVQNTNS